MKRIMLTGASGYIGRHLHNVLVQNNYEVIPVVMKNEESLFDGPIVVISTLEEEQKWEELVNHDIDIVIHLAAKVHVPEKKDEEKDSFYRINRDATVNLYKWVCNTGIQRFICMSTAGVYQASSNSVINENSIKFTETAYIDSKLQADKMMIKLSKEMNKASELIILRPPMVYGKNVPGNFSKVVKMLQNHVPFPFGGIKRNRKSFISIDNLIDALLTVVRAEHVHGGVYLVSDNESISSTGFFKLIKKATNSKSIFINVPPYLLEKLFSLVGKDQEIKKITSSFKIDCSKFIEKYNWNPPFTLEEGVMMISE